MSNHRSAVIQIIVTPAPAPGVIGSSQNNTNMAPAAPTNGASYSYAQDHWTRYSHLKGVEDAKNTLIEDVLSRYDAVVRQLKGLIDEQNASNSNESAIMHQQAEYIVYLQNLMNGNPFVVVVVDGNNFLFNDAFIRDGEKGGRSAAVAFKDELTEWVPKDVEDAPSDFKILIKVYADFKGVASAYMKGGVIEKVSTLAEFARGFNTLFDFVDIGSGDANSKIVGMSWSHSSSFSFTIYTCVLTAPRSPQAVPLRLPLPPGHLRRRSAASERECAARRQVHETYGAAPKRFHEREHALQDGLFSPGLPH